MQIDRDAFDNAPSAPLAELEILAAFEGVPTGPRAVEPAPTPVPLREVRIAGTLVGALAHFGVEQRFDLPGSPDGDPIDARYRFPVPPGAAVQAVTMRFGDEVIEAVLRERREARDHFEHARATGRPAVLVTDSGRGILTLEAAGITPGIPLVVTTELVALSRLEADGRGTLRIPLTTAPKYLRQDEDPTAGEANPLAVAPRVPYSASLELRVPLDIIVSSPTHQLTFGEGDGERVIGLVGTATPDRDLVIETRPATGAALSGSVLLGETRDGRTPWLATVIAPDASPGASRLPRSLVLLVDRSGSMGGPKWATASWAVRSLVAGMRDEDSLLVIAFDDRLERSGPGLSPMDAAARDAVASWVRGIDARGGTELGPALQEALATGPAPGSQADILVLTDGQVGDTARILSLVEDTPWRVSVLCIDSAPNTPLATTLAERGGGDSWFLTSRPGAENITDAVDRITACFAAPAVGDLVVEAPAGGAIGRVKARDGGISVEVGAMPAGAVRLVAGWTDGEATGFRVTGGAAADLPVRTGREPAVNALVAAARIRTLEQAERLADGGRSEDQARREAARAGMAPATLAATADVYRPIAGSVHADPLVEALRAEVVRLSLDGRVLSSRTAFVGVRSKAGRRSSEQVDVPSALPEGWDEPGIPTFARLARSRMPSPSASSGASVQLRMMATGPMMLAEDAFDAGVPAPPAMTSRPSPRAARSGRPSAQQVPPVVLRFAVGDLVAGTVVPAPVGTWSSVRVSGTVGDTTGAYLVIWTTDRTRPLFRARLADLLAAESGRRASPSPRAR